MVTKSSNLFGTCPTFAAPYHPATNGAVERANSTLVSILRKMAPSDSLHWPQFLDAALLAYHISYHRFIGLSIFKALYGREPNFPSSLMIVNSLGPVSTEAGIRLITNKLFRLQALASASLSAVISR